MAANLYQPSASKDLLDLDNTFCDFIAADIDAGTEAANVSPRSNRIEEDINIRTIEENSLNETKGSSKSRKDPSNLAIVGFTSEKVVGEGDQGLRFWNAFNPVSFPGEELHGQYDVSFVRGPIGLRLESDYYGTRAVVNGFFTLSDGRVGAAKMSGLISPGDYITHIDDYCVLNAPFSHILELFHTVQNGPFTLRMRRRGVLSSGIQKIGDGILEARRAIFDAKARFLTPPRPEDGMVYCSVTRHRGRHLTSFNLHRDDTGEFLIACSMNADASGHLIFHTQQDSHLRLMKDITTAQDSSTYIGCMVPNFIGTEHRIMDFRKDFAVFGWWLRNSGSDILYVISKSRSDSPHGDWSTYETHYYLKTGVDCRDAAAVSASEITGAFEVGAVLYDVNVLGRVPNFFKVLLRRPRLGGNDENTIVGSTDHILDSPRQGILKCYMDSRRMHGQDAALAAPLRSFKKMWSQIFLDQDELDREIEAYGSVGTDEGSNIMVFETKRPSWNPELDAWVLNFNGRVRIPSKKNFMLTAEHGNLAAETEFGEGKVLLRQGKMSKSRFSMDFRHPFPPIVALAVCCSTFTDKRAVT